MTNETKVYRITEEQCKEQVRGRVCPGCGGELRPIETVDNSDNPTFWSGCTACNQFTWGYEPRI